MTRPPYVTEQQNKWFQSVQAGLEADTGVKLEDWIAIAKTCPETKHKARLSWFKTTHGLGINRASLVLSAAFNTGLGWDNPNALLENLWKTPETRAVYDAVEEIAKSLGNDVVIGARKSFSSFSRRVQFAALRPTRLGIRLGLAIPLESTPDLSPPLSSDSWSDRLTAVRLLHNVQEIDDGVTLYIRQAYELSE